MRRAILNINRMSFSDMQRLLEEIVLFGGPSAGESSVSHGEQTYDKMFATPSDMPAHHNTLQYREETFEAYIRALHASDYQGALTLLHRYFDYEAGPFSGGSSANRGMRQHALLNLTAFHMQHEEYEAARLVCTEGIQISRAAGDLICLNALTSMMRRLAFEDSESSSSARTAQHSSEVGRMPGTHDAREDPGGYVPPMDQLWDVRYGLASVSSTCRRRCMPRIHDQATLVVLTATVILCFTARTCYLSSRRPVPCKGPSLFLPDTADQLVVKGTPQGEEASGFPRQGPNEQPSRQSAEEAEMEPTRYGRLAWHGS